MVSNSSVPSASTPPNSPHPSIATASGPSIPPVTASFPLPVDASAPLYATILHQYTLEGKRQQEAYNDCPTFVLQDAPKLTMQNEELVARAIHVFLGTKKSPLQQYWTSCQLAGTFPMMLQSILQKDRPTWNALMRVFPATAKLLTSGSGWPGAERIGRDATPSSTKLVRRELGAGLLRKDAKRWRSISLN